MTALNTSSTDSWYRAGSPKTGQTDDARIKEITVLPPPEHLIRFFPIRGTAVETLISDTRRSIHNIMRAQDDRLLVIVGPCSIHDPAAALDYLGPIWSGVNITDPRWTSKGEYGWLNYHVGGLGEIVDRYRFEAGCIVEHVSCFVLPNCLVGLLSGVVAD